MATNTAGTFIALIKPQLDINAMKKAESTMLRRVKMASRAASNAAKTFGKGGVIGGALMALSAVIGTEYEKVSKKIDDTLDKTDKLATLQGQLKQLGTELSNVDVVIGTKIAQITGVEQEALIKHLTKFQKARGEDKSLEQFKDGNVLTEFFNLMSAYGNLEGDERTKEMAKVFGNRGAIELQELTQTNIPQLIKEVTSELLKAGVTGAKLDKAVTKGSALEGEQAKNRAINETIDLVKSVEIITPKHIQKQNAMDALIKAQEREALKRIDAIATAQLSLEAIKGDINQTLTIIQNDVLPLISKVTDAIGSGSNILFKIAGIGK